MKRCRFVLHHKPGAPYGGELPSDIEALCMHCHEARHIEEGGTEWNPYGCVPMSYRGRAMQLDLMPAGFP